MLESNMVAGTRRVDDVGMEVKLPTMSEIPYYRISPSLFGDRPLLPLILPADSLPKRRGAPKKPKNALVKSYRLKNTSGKTFRFSFVPQILISHLHHLFNMKKKSRYQRNRWVRSYCVQGLSLQKEIFSLVGENFQVLNFKRTVSVKELKDWLDGQIFCMESSQESTSSIRMQVFRLFCILKTIDLNVHFGLDFCIQDNSERAYLLFKRYICSDIWDELGLPRITEHEINEQITSAVSKHS